METTSAQFGTAASRTSQIRETSRPLPGTKLVLALLTRLLCAAALALPVFGARASAVFTSLYSFSGTNDGAYPSAPLVQGSDGDFYGTTTVGGKNGGHGTVFKITPTGTLTRLYSFTGGNDGGNPAAGLVPGSDGNFYGTTSGEWSGSSYDTVFKISPNGALTTLNSLFSNGGYFLVFEEAGLVQGSDGYFYGTTPGRSPYVNAHTAYGTVFRISPNGALTTLHTFDAADGLSPGAGLVQGSDGNFYGTTTAGGAYGSGTVFKISPNGALTSLYSFTAGNDGSYPEAGLVQGSDRNFYGTTYFCVHYGPGTVFKISPNGALTSLHSFTGRNDGGDPNGLTQGSDGNFYGTTAGGGTHTNGTVFKISPDGALTSLYSFAGGNDGAYPGAGLVQGSDGNFYGTTSSGGKGGGGTVFRLTVTPAAPAFQPVTLTNGTLSLTWSTEVGGPYQLQYSPDLGSSNWANLGSAVTATGATLSTSDSVTNGPRRFYRVVLSP